MNLTVSLQDTISFSTLCVSIVGIILVIRQLIHNREAYLETSQFQRRSETLKFYSSHRNFIRKKDIKIKKFLGISRQNNVTKEDAERIASNADILQDCISLLSLMERLSIGIEMNIYDYRVTRELSGTAVCSIFRQYENYIIEARRRENNARFYVAFQRVALRLEGELGNL